ncbi:hypothetical protein [Streptomyces clavuligerus]|uniref:hypothetical protein n=4 Tax=Streptomyces clavuligerus TaxID=1901 RepID=UPI00018517C7|nr:hypothetical protein [Streptomyces clavuligerus]WDN56433.1 hypothetical protein LL058_31835 [Streptomyces clavuligerus]
MNVILTHPVPSGGDTAEPAPTPVHDSGTDWLAPGFDSPVLARISRRLVLQARVDAGASCASAPAPGVGRVEWFRGEREPYAAWKARTLLLLKVCGGCPARAACRELALRDLEGMDLNRGEDDMVRGGLLTGELRDLGTAQARDIEEAVARDDEAAGVFRRRRTLGAGLDRDTLGTASGSAGQTLVQSGSGDRRPAVGGFVPVFNPGPAERRPAERRTPPPVEAGVVDDVQDEEERDWLEPHDDPAQQFHRLVRHLAADGDQRAAAAGRKARRTLAEMAPGHVRQPLLTPTPTPTGREAVR